MHTLKVRPLKEKKYLLRVPKDQTLNARRRQRKIAKREADSKLGTYQVTLLANQFDGVVSSIQDKILLILLFIK